MAEEPVGATPLRGHRVGIWLAGALLGLIVGFPLWELFAGALAEGWGSAARALRAPGGTEAVLNTLWTGVVVTVLAVAAGTTGAFVTERSATPGRRWLRVGVVLPLVVPPFVTAMSWAQAYGPAGLLDDLTGLALPGLYGPAGVVVVTAVHSMPLAYLVVAGGLASRAEPDFERAARVSGAGPLTTFSTVTLPLLRPALAGASALVFVTTINSFDVPAVLGRPAGFATVTTRIYADLVLAADPAAFTRVLVLASGLVLVTVTLVGVTDALVDVGGSARTAGPSGSPMRAAGRRWPWAVALWGYLALVAGLPLLALVATAVTRAVGLSPTPGNWTLDNFAEAVTGTGATALGRSLVLAVAAATTVLGLGGLLAALGRRGPGRALATTATLTFAVPGSALAVAVLLAYGPWLRDTLLLIFVAYLAKFLALGHRPIAGAADRLASDLYRAARVSGAGGPTAVRTIVVPLLSPALVGAWLLVFLLALHELTMSSLLYGPGSETLAVVILNLQQLGDRPVTSALAVLLTLLVMAGSVPLLVARRAWAREGEK
ncbi:iron ABC transporter permease [soil metagenome]